MLYRDGEPTSIACPGCAGVLSAFTEGREDFIRYVCTVGHSFSLPALLYAKEDQFEYLMWAVISVLAHLEMGYRDLLERGYVDVAVATRQDVETRIETVRTYAQLLRELIEADRPPASEAGEIESGAV